jgi:hypothetical protein
MGFSLRKMKMVAFSILFFLKGYKGQMGIEWVKQTADDGEPTKGDDTTGDASSEDPDEN